MRHNSDLTTFQKYRDSYNMASPKNVKKSDVYEYAEKIHKFAVEHLKNEKFELDAFITALGGNINILNLDTNSSDLLGSVFVHDVKSFDIIIPEYTGPLTDKFTIAHELGHYLIHSDCGKNSKVYADRNESGPLEWEANWFAAAFLMPTSKLKEFINRKNITETTKETYSAVMDVSVEFMVSKSAAMYRLKDYFSNGY